jgi:cell division protein FtsB
MNKLWRYVILAISLYIVFMGSQALLRIARVEQERRGEWVKVSEARRRNHELSQTMARLDTPAYLEDLARQKLGLVKPGEVVYKIVENPIGK